MSLLKKQPPVVSAEEWPAQREMDWAMREGTRTRKEEFRLRSSMATELEWVHKETGEVRRPDGRERKFLKGVPFQAAGRIYFSLKQLEARRKEKYRFWYLDCYDRPVLLVLERFPCFDSSDAIHEDRFYYWYLLCQDGVLTMIRTSDEDPFIWVAEDAAFLEHNCWNELKKEGCLDRW